MKSKPILGTTPDEDKKSLFVDFNCDWPDLLPWVGRNWRNFTLIKADGELDHMTGRVVLEFAVLGLGVSITYIYDHSFNSKMMTMKDQMIAEIEAETGCEVKDPHGVLDNLPNIH